MLMFKVVLLVTTFISRCRFPRDMPLNAIIRKRYGNETVKLTRKLEKMDWKHRKTLLNIDFLTNCRNNDVIPRFLEFKTSNKKLRKTTSYLQCQRILLDEELDTQRRRLKVFRSKLDSSKNLLNEVMPLIDYTHILSVIFASSHSRVTKEQARLDEKVAKLIQQKAPPTLDPDKIIKNYSKLCLSEPEVSLLSKGLNYAIKPSRINYADYCLNYELFYRDIQAIKSLPNRNKDFLHSKLKDIALTSFREYQNGNNKPDNLSPDEYAALKNLADNHNVIIQKADKGNCIVILDKDAYLRNVGNIISDTSKFEPITFPKDEVIYMLSLEKKIREILDKLLKSKQISKAEHNKMYPIGSRPGILYGLAKVHKPTKDGHPPMRPILSAIGTPTYNLAKFLIPLLNPIASNEFTVNNSFQFAREITSQDASLFMSSFDVESLFTSIPLNETIEIATNELFEGRDKVANLEKHDFKKLLELATKESCFIFNGKYYRQTDGVAMGNPLGPTMANLFMCHLEKNWLPKCPPDFKPVFYRRYVDDTFLLFRKKEHIQQFKTFLNSYHLNINFTDDSENDDSLSFLDVKVVRESNEFHTSVYRKKTYTGLYTSFKSLIPSSYKKGLILTLLFRIYSVCSSWSYIDKEISFLKNILRLNGYPISLIEKCIKQFLNKLHDKKEKKDDEDQDKTQLTICLPFLGSASIKTKTLILKYIKSNIPDCHPKIVFSSKRRLSNFFSFKDRLPISLNSHLVYKIVCPECNLCYYGLTERHFKVRAFDHLGLSFLTGKPIKGVDTSIKSHCRQELHTITMDDITIIARAENSFHLRIKESLLIKRDVPVLNNNIYSTPLHLF